MRPSHLFVILALFTLLISGCAPAPEAPSETAADSAAPDFQPGPDPHSFARPDEARVEHIGLDLEVDFDARQLRGRASLQLAEAATEGSELRLDTRDLDIERIVLDGGDGPSDPADYSLAAPVPHLGSALIVSLQAGTRTVHIDYATRPEAAALQWLTPEQTAGGKHPFLFSQSQAALARTWVPCQDTPSVRFTYDATLRVPPALIGLMSASNPTEKAADGIYQLRMGQPIPSYLLAVAVGDLEFRGLGERAGVYAEPSVLDAAAWEYAETEEMMVAVEALYGPYRWERYDILVLPPSFPFGGMENPRLTFVNPTTIAGDRSLVALIAHELAHSWSGNLVTNATWNDFWLNEGFTTYLEMRIMEELYGREYAEMLLQLSRQDLDAEVAGLEPGSADSHLRLDLQGRDPDDGMSAIAYDKGQLFLRTLEEEVGRERFDAFLRRWFDEHAFASVTTDRFVDFLRSELVGDDSNLAERLELDAWIDGPGVPANAAPVAASGFAAVEAELAAWHGGRPAAELGVDDWTTHHWLHFLRQLSEGPAGSELSTAQLADLDAAFGFTATGNAEILHAWLLHTIRYGYTPADQALEDFLTGMGRRKFLMPLYQALVATDTGRARAQEIYDAAKGGYHPVAVSSVEALLGGS